MGIIVGIFVKPSDGGDTVKFHIVLSLLYLHDPASFFLVFLGGNEDKKLIVIPHY